MSNFILLAIEVFISYNAFLEGLNATNSDYPLFKKSRQRLVLSSHSRQKYFKLKGQFTL